MCNPHSKKTCGDTRCPTCFERSLASVPAAVKAWSTRNLHIRPIDSLKGSRFKVYLKCEDEKCSHDYDISPFNYMVGKRCPFCSKPARKLCDEECSICYANSFATHAKSKYWSSNNLKLARQTHSFQNAPAEFDCDVCDHVLMISPANIMNEHWCSYCAHQRVCGDDGCRMCHENSFASHAKSQNWSPKNLQTPREVIKGGRSRAFFDCECGHAFEANVSDITRGRWCGFCSTPPKYLCTDENCKKCYDKSFASHPKASYLLDKDPRLIFCWQSEPERFQCERGHIWCTAPANVSRGTWCPSCKHKTERMVLEFLQRLYPDVEAECKYEWARWPATGRQLSFDFVIGKAVIELDGDQHFIQVGKWKSPELTRERDLYRMRVSREHGFTIIRILQRDVSFNRYDWKTELLKAITDGGDHFLCKNGEYDEMKAQLMELFE